MSLTHQPLPPIRVLIADDSAVMRTTLARMLEANPLRVEALKRIMSECPCPVIMFSSATREGAEVTLEALSAGAFDYLPKVSFQPCANTLKLQHDLIEKIEAASHSHLSRTRALFRPLLPPSAPRTHSQETPQPVPRIVVLGTSTGGPQALQGLLPELPGDLPLAMIVVQHMPIGFYRALRQAFRWPFQGESLRGPARRSHTAGDGLYRSRRPAHHSVKELAPGVDLPLRLPLQHRPQAVGGCHHAFCG